MGERRHRVNSTPRASLPNSRVFMDAETLEGSMPADTELRQHLSPKIFGSIRPEQVAWAQFAAFPPGGQLATLVGDASKPGPYVIRVKIPAGMKPAPHRHPEDRIYTVISGVFYIGQGERSTRPP